MSNKRFALISLLLLVFAGGMLAGCGGNPDPAADRKNEPADVKEMRKEKEGGE